VKIFTGEKMFLSHLYCVLSVPEEEKIKVPDVLWEVPEEDCIAYAKPPKVWQQTWGNQKCIRSSKQCPDY